MDHFTPILRKNIRLELAVAARRNSLAGIHSCGEKSKAGATFGKVMFRATCSVHVGGGDFTIADYSGACFQLLVVWGEKANLPVLHKSG